MNRPAMTSCCMACIPRGCAARTGIACPPSRQPMTGIVPRSWTTAVVPVARSSISSLGPSGSRAIIAARPSSRSCVALSKGSPPSTWPQSCILIVDTCWRAATRSKRWSSSRFPPCGPLPDEVTEADELYQNAGEKGRQHRDPLDPPRRRANKRRGHGSWETDRVPIAGVVGRESGQIRVRVCHHSARATLQPFVEQHTQPHATVNTDEWQAYDRLPATGRGHATVCHTPRCREGARDDDGDGLREVHDNTLEGIWTGLRNFLRPFRGVSKWFLSQYVAIFAWAYNLKQVTAPFLRAMMRPSTLEPT